MADRLLLADGASFLLLADGVSRILLGVNTPPVTLDEVVVDVVAEDATMAVDDAVVDVVAGTLAMVLDATAVDVVTNTLAGGAPTTATPTIAGTLTRPRWRVVVADLDGVQYAELPSAVVEELVERDNAGEEARGTLSLEDPGWPEVRYIGEDNRELQVWLDGDLKLWGPLNRGPVDLNRRTVQWQAHSRHEYLRRRHVGDAERLNKLTNPGFESGLGGGWVAETGGIAAPTIGGEAIDGIVSNEGAQHLKLVNSGVIAQTFPVEHTYDGGLLFRFVAWFRRTAGALPDGGVAGAIYATDPETGLRYPGTVMTIDANSPTDAWFRLFCDIQLTKPRVPYSVRCAFVGPVSGHFGVDSTQGVFDDSLTVAFPGEDVSVFARYLIWHLQDAGYGKDDLRIGTNCPPTGTVRLLGEPHGQHRYGMAVLDGLVRAGYFDHSIELTPTTQTFTVWPNGRGTARPEWRLEVGRNIASGSIDVDGSQTNRSVLYQADASDFARDEASALAGSGPTLEVVRRAAQGTPIRFLGEFARRDVDHESATPTIPDVVVFDRDRLLIHGLVAGDTIPMLVDVGNPSLDGIKTFRVTEKHTLGSADRLRLRLAPVPA